MSSFDEPLELTPATAGVDGGRRVSRAGRPDEVRVLRLGRSSLAVSVDGAVVRWQSHDDALPLLVDRSADVHSGAVFEAVTGTRDTTGDRQEVVCTALRLGGAVVEVQDRVMPAAEPVGRAQPGTALVRLVRCPEAALDVVHRLRLLPSDLRWFTLNGLAVSYLRERKITVDGGTVALRSGNVTSRLRAPQGAWAALTVAVDGHLPADADRLAKSLAPEPTRADPPLPDAGTGE